MRGRAPASGQKNTTRSGAERTRRSCGEKESELLWEKIHNSVTTDFTVTLYCVLHGLSTLERIKSQNGKNWNETMGKNGENRKENPVCMRKKGRAAGRLWQARPGESQAGQGRGRQQKGPPVPGGPRLSKKYKNVCAGGHAPTGADTYREIWWQIVCEMQSIKCAI